MSEKYDLNIDLNVLNHLGLNLYSNVPAVLSELIANAWDADATKVTVCIKTEPDNQKIIVQDDGCGMDSKDLQQKYLTVGYQRRTDSSGDRTPAKQRPVMGRKGIGKLSVFSIAREITVITKKENDKLLAIRLNVEDIQESIKKQQTYHPEVIGQPSDIILGDSGTVLILDNLKKRVNESLGGHLRQRVARRFSIIDTDFKVFVNNDEITLADRNYFGKLEYVMVYKDFDTKKFNLGGECISTRPHLLKDGGSSYSIGGWIGLVRESGALQSDGDNLNKISILTRGKLALEDILDSYREGGLYTKYVIGELEADFLDLTEKEDIATSSRQDFIQNDARFEKLRSFVEQELRVLKQERVKLKDSEGEARAREIPAISEWYDGLGSDSRTEAKKLFGKINQIATDQEHRKTLYKHGVLAFEHLQHKEKLNQLEQLDINNLEAAVQLFSELDDIEASWYYQITEGRLDVIKKLTADVAENALEKVIQKHIYNHLWLIDPSWDRATETPSMEQTVTAEFNKLSENLTPEERKGRIDIRYKKTSGKHIIIELKRASVQIADSALMGQVDKYIKALRKQLNNANEGGPVEAICLIGKDLTDWDDRESRERSENSLAAKNIRVVTYKQLIKDTEESYKNYLDKARDKGRIKRLLDEIEDS